MRKKQQSFKQILSNVAGQNMKVLMHRAVTANKLAKTASMPGAKRSAYAVKVHALTGLKQNFPHLVNVETDWRQGSGIVLIQIPGQKFGLHAPAERFALDC
jgi:hypothetical protein